MTPARLVRPTVGLMPTTPLLEAGQTIEPSVSVPRAAAARLAATDGGRARAGAAGVAVEHVGVAGLAAPAAPAAGRVEAAEVGPLAEVGLAEDDGAGGAQARGDGGVLVRRVADQRQRAGGGRHAVGGVDVVLEQDRDAVQRPAHVAVAALAVELPGDAPRRPG